jgi:hypothetical protein
VQNISNKTTEIWCDFELCMRAMRRNAKIKLLARNEHRFFLLEGPFAICFVKSRVLMAHTISFFFRKRPWCFFVFFLLFPFLDESTLENAS